MSTKTLHLVPESVIDVLSIDEAREVTDNLKSALEISWELIVKAYQGRIWEPLGYDNWETYTSAEFGHLRLRLPLAEREQVISSLSDHGLSTRAIAAATGESQSTVSRDRRKAPESSDSGVTGMDGKTYPAAKPVKDGRGTAGERRIRKLAEAEQYLTDGTVPEGHTLHEPSPFARCGTEPETDVSPGPGTDLDIIDAEIVPDSELVRPRSFDPAAYTVADLKNVTSELVGRDDLTVNEFKKIRSLLRLALRKLEGQYSLCRQCEKAFADTDPRGIAICVACQEKNEQASQVRRASRAES
jgi:DNA-binding transcriptional ArsR family regulator